MLLLETVDTVDAVFELAGARSVALGYAMARSGKDPKVKSAQRSLIRRAYPEVTEEPTQEG